MKKLLLLLILTVPFLHSSCDFIQKRNMFSNDQDSLLVYQKKQDSLKFVDSIRNLRSELSQLKNRHQRLMDSIKTSTAPQKATGYKYHIIVGSFRNQEYLDSYSRFVREKGFQTKILENEYGFKMVAVESFNSWGRAANTLEELRDGFEKTAWIYVEN